MFHCDLNAEFVFSGNPSSEITGFSSFTWLFGCMFECHLNSVAYSGNPGNEITGYHLHISPCWNANSLLTCFLW